MYVRSEGNGVNLVGVVIDSLFINARYTICNWVLIAIRSLCKSCLLNNKTVVFRISPWSYLSLLLTILHGVRCDGCLNSP